MALNLFTIVYVAFVGLSAIQSLVVLYLVALLDSIKSGQYLQIYALYPVLSSCGFLLYTTPNMVQSGYHPRLYPEYQPEINRQIAVSYVWSFIAWLHISSQSTSEVQTGALTISILFALNAILHLVMSVVSCHHRQPPISKEPLLVSQQNRSQSASIRYEKLAENILLAVGWIAIGFLSKCLYNEIETGISFVRTGCLLLGMLSASLSLYGYHSRKSIWLQLLEASVTFHMQCYQIHYMSDLYPNDTHFTVQHYIYVILSLVFFMLTVTRAIEEKRTGPQANFLFELSRSCSSKFTIGAEDDEILLEEIPMPPMPSG